MAERDDTMVRVQQLFDTHGIRDGHAGDKPYVLTVRDHVPPGWFGLVKELVEDLIRHGWDRRLFQVKEKFGALRFYISYEDKALVDKTIEARDRSETICQECGKPGTMLEDHGWYSTLCTGCGARWRAERAGRER